MGAVGLTEDREESRTAPGFLVQVTGRLVGPLSVIGMWEQKLCSV